MNSIKKKLHFYSFLCLFYCGAKLKRICNSSRNKSTSRRIAGAVKKNLFRALAAAGTLLLGAPPSSCGDEGWCTYSCLEENVHVYRVGNSITINLCAETEESLRDQIEVLDTLKEISPYGYKLVIKSALLDHCGFSPSYFLDPTFIDAAIHENIHSLQHSSSYDIEGSGCETHDFTFNGIIVDGYYLELPRWEYFHVSEIYEYSGGGYMAYTYLSGTTGDQGFWIFTTELNAYSESNLSYEQNETTGLEQALTFMRYYQIYLEYARNEHPSDYRDMMNDERLAFTIQLLHQRLENLLAIRIYREDVHYRSLESLHEEVLANMSIIETLYEESGVGHLDIPPRITSEYIRGLGLGINIIDLHLDDIPID